MTASVDSLIAVIKRSGLVDGTALTENLDSFSASDAEKTAGNFARYLTDNNVITLWQADKLVKGKHKGFYLGKYKLLKILGKGGMSSVYLAEHVLMKRRCAIKVLPHKRVDDSSYLERFHREAQAVAALDHPNIVRAYDVDHETDGSLEINFLVMEYVEGQNLYELVQREGVLSAVKAADLIRQGALGLEHAHQAGLVHRDVKPGNFLIDKNHIVKLMDLGLARVYEESDDFSLTIEHDEKVLGTADYLAPEQAVDSHSVDARADIYGLGCTMYYLLTGHPPFNEGTLTQRLLAHQTKEPPAIELERDDVPQSLLDIVSAMMKKSKHERMQSASEVVDLLTDWLNENGGTEWTPPEDRLQRSTDSDASPHGRKRRTDSPAGSSKVGVELGSFLSTLNESDVQQATSSSSIGRSKKTESPTRESKKTPRDPHTKIHSIPALDRPTPAVPPKDYSSSEETPQSPRPQLDTTVIKSDQNSLQPQIDTLSSPTPSESISTQTPASKKTTRSLRKNVVIDFKNKRTLIFLGAIIASVIGILIAASFRTDKKAVTIPTVPASNKPDSSTRPSVAGNVIHVGPKGNFGTLQEAVDYIQSAADSGSSNFPHEIQIASGVTLKAGFQIDNSGLGGFPKDVKIIGQGPQLPVLQSTVSTVPVISLTGVEKLTIENLIVDATNTTTACELAGYLVRTRFINLTFRNVAGTAIHASGVTGVGNEKFTLEGCVFESESEEALFLRFEPSQISNTRKILIRNCRFIGPAEACLTFSETTWDIEVRQNIFHNSQQGVVFQGVEQDLNSIMLADNTFHNLKRAIVFETGPSEMCQQLSFSQNLFAGIKDREIWVARNDADLSPLNKGAAPSRNNWTTRLVSTDESNSLNIFADNGQQNKPIEFQSTDPTQDNFLKPKSGEVRQVIKNKVGPQNFIGAVAP